LRDFTYSRYNTTMSALQSSLTRAQAWDLLRQYNTDPFHLQHALTVEGVMRWFATDQGFAAEEDFWGIVGLLHDIDFEEYPEEHCLKAPELLRSGGADEAVIHAVCSHGYGLTAVNAKPEHLMEKVLFATDELTGLIWAAAIIRPSKSVMDMELKSVKKKYKTPAFAAGCSRAVIENGAALIGWELDTLIEKTILAMRSCEARVAEAMAELVYWTHVPQLERDQPDPGGT
jgi:predicted hydrolase (HD superfamily)